MSTRERGSRTPTTRHRPAPPPALLDAAADAFYRSGYVGAALSDVADAFGVQKGSLYHYIETKEDLLFAIVATVHEETKRRNVRWRSEDDPLAAIEVFLEDHIRSAIDNIVYTTVYYQEFRRLSPERKRKIVRARDSYERNLRQLVEAAKAGGRLREDVDPHLAVLGLFGLMNWVCYWYRPEGRLPADEVVENLVRIGIASLSHPVP